jgi:hypothetical protein
MKKPDKRRNLSEVNILSPNIVVNPKLSGRINRLTGMDIYGLRVGGLTMVVYSSTLSYYQSKNILFEYQKIVNLDHFRHLLTQ